MEDRVLRYYAEEAVLPTSFHLSLHLDVLMVRRNQDKGVYSWTPVYIP